jgi:hypothetical protein
MSIISNYDTRLNRSRESFIVDVYYIGRNAKFIVRMLPASDVRNRPRITRKLMRKLIRILWIIIKLLR